MRLGVLLALVVTLTAPGLVLGALFIAGELTASRRLVAPLPAENPS